MLSPRIVDNPLPRWGTLTVLLAVAAGIAGVGDVFGVTQPDPGHDDHLRRYEVAQPASPRGHEVSAVETTSEARRNGLALPAGARLATDAELTELARRTLESLSSLGISAPGTSDRTFPELEWAPAALRHTPRRTYVHLRQTFQDRPVLETRLSLQLDPSGTISHLRGSFQTPPDPGARRLPDRGISLAEARSAALEGLRPAPAPDEVRWLISERAWFPMESVSGTPPDWIPVWHLRVSTDTPPGDWRCLVDERSGDLLARENQLLHSTISGSITGLVEPVTSGNDAVELPFAHLQVTLRQGEDATLTTTTDAAGAYTFDVEDGTEWTWQAEMRGSGAWVRDLSQSLFTPVVTVDDVTTGETSLRWDDATSTPATRDAFYHATLAYAYVRALDPGETLAPLDDGVQVRVDDGTGVCNAYWNGTFLNFYADGGGCVATARIADVVYHEYGHAVTHYLYFPFLPPRDMNEAWSDFFAASLTGDSRIGRGLLGPDDTFLRDIGPDRVWPVDTHPDPHIRGLILASALWNLRETLGSEVVDPLFHYARYGLAMSFDEFLLDLLLYDDDDGDLTNGSPHFGPLVEIFGEHGIGDYTVRLTAAEIPDVEDPGERIDAEVHIDALLGLDPQALRLFVSTNAGPFDPLPLQATETPRLYRASIPAPPPDTEVRYYWAAADTAEHSATLPEGAPEQSFGFYVGPDLIPPSLAHTPPEVVTSDLPQLTVRTRAGDNTGRLARVYVEVRRDDGPPDTTIDLEAVSEGEQSEASYQGAIDLDSFEPGDVVRYRIIAEDAAAVPNTRTVPEEGDFRVDVRRGRSFDLETDSGPFENVDGFTWGVPSDAVGAWSGERVWATVLDGVYPDGDTASMQLGPFDLRTFDRATLRFEHYYRFEAGFDGARVLVSQDEGRTWRALTPAGGYPTENVAVFGQPGYSGISGGWEHAEFPLDHYLDQDIWLRWEAISDPFVADLGWYLDDISIVEQQSRAGPLGFRVRDQDNQRVELRWEPPIGVDLESPRFLGFRLYRFQTGSPVPEVPLAELDGRATRYLDLDVINDVTYHYRLVAAYDEGESAGLEVSATPAAPLIGFDVSAIDYDLRGLARSDTIVTVRNLSGGQLEFDAFLAEADWSIDDARLVLDVESMDETPVTVIEDPRDASGIADLAGLTAQRLSDDAGSRLRFGVTSHVAWQDPLDDFGGVLLIDTDQSLTTSQGNFTFGWDEDVNMGWEYAVVFGRLPREFGSQAPALLYSGCCPERIPVVLTDAAFPENASELAFSIPLSELDFPSKVHLSVLLTRRLSEAPFDRAPEAPEVPWLIREPRHGRVRANDAQPFSFEFDARELANGDYHAKVILETNDLTRPLIEVPVTLRVSDLLPQNPADLRFDSEPQGMRIGFATPAGFVATAAEIERFALSEEIWRRITPEPITPDSSGAFQFLDTTSIPGEVYRYRMRVLFDFGTTVVFGPYQVAYSPELPERVALDFQGVHPFQQELRLSLALPQNSSVRATVYDPLGRRIRVFEDGELRAGLHPLVWDGRSDNGNAVASGHYFLKLRVTNGSESEERTLRVVRIR